MKKKILLLTLPLILINCTNNTTTIERKGEPTIYGVQKNDPEMEKSIIEARKTINNFNKAFESNNPNFHSFSLKTKFETPNGSEHLWICNLYKDRNEYYGVVGNEPEFTTEVNLGDTIKIDKNKITDWKYIDDQKLCGGYTIRLLRNRMTESDRKLFDTQTGLIIE